MSSPATKRPQRKGKKAWRRNIDLSEIETGLTSRLHDERTIDTKKATDAALFTIEKSGDAVVKKTVKRLRVDEILAARSNVPAIKTRLSPKLTVVSVNGKQRSVSKFQTLHLKNRVVSNTKPAPPAPVEVTAETPWHALPTTVYPEYVIETLKLTVKKPSVPVLLAIAPQDAIHPGQSYNPKHEDHQELIVLATMEQEKKIAALDRAKQCMAYPAELDQLDDDAMLHSGDEQESEEDEDEVKQTFMQTVTERKTKSQRNKLRKQKDLAKKALKDKLYRQLQKLEVPVLDDAQTNVSNVQKPRAIKRLGPNKFVKADTVVALTSELSTTVREMLQHTNAFQGVFDTLQERGMIEQRHKANRKRKYLKRSVEIHSYKRFE